MSRMKKYCMGILLCVILSGCVNSVHVRAAEEEIRDTPVPADEKEYGILVIECMDGAGTIEISCGDIKADFNYDYYEMEIPLGEELIVTVHPYPAYELESVKLGDKLLKSSEGRYRMILTESYMTLCVTYKAASNGSADTNNGSDSESTDNKVHHSVDEESGNSVNSISYDVVVTYLDSENGELEDIPGVSDESGNVVTEIVTGDEVSVDMASTENVGTDTVDLGIAHNTDENMPEEADMEIPAEDPKSIESADTDVKTEKDDIIFGSTDDTVAGMRKIPVKSKEEFDNTPNVEEKSVLILSNFPLYLALVCCMIIVKRIIWMKKVKIDG